MIVNCSDGGVCARIIIIKPKTAKQMITEQRAFEEEEEDVGDRRIVKDVNSNYEMRC